MINPLDPCRKALDVQSTRAYGAKLHHLLADTDLSTEADGNVGQAPGQLNNPSSARSWRV